MVLQSFPAYDTFSTFSSPLPGFGLIPGTAAAVVRQDGLEHRLAILYKL
jgi:hypothetical protein